MAEGIRKEKNLPERITRSILNNEAQFVQSLKIFANTSIVGSQGAQSGGSSGGPGGVGNYFRKDGDIVDGVFATRPSIASIIDDEIDISKITATNYSSKVFLVPEGGSGPDELNFILGGSTTNQVTGAEFPGQWLIIQPIAGATITINNDTSGFGDPEALPRHNIRTPDGNPVVLENEQAVLLNFDSTSGQWSFLSAVGSSGGVAADPNCFPEKDSGDQSGALTVFFNRNRFCRMRVIGDLNITFDTSEMLFGKIYFLTVETLQDPTGGHTVTFADAPFENGITPVIFEAGNRYTSIRFYAYKLDEGSAVRIFAFDELQPFPLQFFDGYIQSRLTTDQTANLGPNKHIEFNLNLATDSTIKVSTAGGQASGLFTNFEIGHLYQCECAFAIESLTGEAEMSLQWYNVTKGTFFGSQARALTVNHSEFDSSLVIAKGFFVADALADVVEVRIKSMSSVDSLKAGDNSAEQMTYAVIKDCGVAGIESLEGNLVPALPPTPAEAVGRFKGYTIGHVGLSAAVTSWASMGGDPGIGVQNSNRVPAMGPGKFKKLRTHISLDSGDNLDVQTWVGGTGSGFLGVPLDGVGVHETDLLDRAFVKDDLIGISMTKGGASGTINFTNWLELDYEETEFWFYTARLNGVQGTNRFSSIIDSGIHTPTAGPSGTTRNDNQRSTGKQGIIKDLVYYGTAPAGTGDAIITIEVNGVAEWVSTDLPVHAAFGIDRFDGVNVEIGADDLVNIKHHMRDGTQAEGIIGIRFLSF